MSVQVKGHQRVSILLLLASLRGVESGAGGGGGSCNLSGISDREVVEVTGRLSG